MKKFLSIVVALAMVLSLFAGVGARSAKAASTLALTPSGSFFGGMDAVGTAPVKAVGTVKATTVGSTAATITVTTAGVGTAISGTVVVNKSTGWISTDANWTATGNQWIVISGAANGTADDAVVDGSVIGLPASVTNGVGTLIHIASPTLWYVDVTTAAAGIIATGTQVTTPVTYTGVTTANDFTTTGDKAITLAAANSLTGGDMATVTMTAPAGYTAATSAVSYLMVSGTASVGDVATVTWQDTAAVSHTVSYTVTAGNTANTAVANNLYALINSLDNTTGNATATINGAVITLIQDTTGAAGNGKTLTATTTAAVTPTLTLRTLGGLSMPAYVEEGKTLQLVAVDQTGATVTPTTWTVTSGPVGLTAVGGLVIASANDGVAVITASTATATGIFAVIVVPVQTVTSMAVNLVPNLPVSTTTQQFGAIASNAAYSQLDYTTQAVWTDTLTVASINHVNGLLTYSTDETGAVNAYAAGITTKVNVKIATGVVTLVTVVAPTTEVIVLSIGSDIVTVDNKATTVDAAPEIVDGRTFVPIRFIAETFGSTVTWLPETKGITIVLGDTTIGLQIGNATAVINGNILALDAAPYIKNSRTMVPLRVITESFGGNVAWDPINHIITITYVLPAA
ncbi:MAG: copper amine oxidase N-terminal domain-containing protein [Candidatus Cryosericum sp.]